MEDRVVITGIGMVTAVGHDRESTWRAVKAGHNGVRKLCGMPGIPDGLLLGATVEGVPRDRFGDRNFPIAMAAAREALADSRLDLRRCDRSRIASSYGTCGGPTPWMAEEYARREGTTQIKPWWENLLYSAVPTRVANRLGIFGPRLVNSTACATGAIATINGMRAILDGQADIAFVGSAQTLHPILSAGFYNMRVLANADDPAAACRPFDANRTGFVMGEGAATLVLERLSSARARGASIYAEILGGALLSDSTHVTDLSADSRPLTHLLDRTLRQSNLVPSDVAYINAHGTGTKQNDAMETRGIRAAFGAAANRLCVSTIKANLGHLVNAAGAVELAITAMALRDGFAPPTVNLTHPDPDCDLDCVPLVGRRRALEHAVKISIAFGGHLAAIALRRWSGAGERCEPAPAAMLRLAA
ncbi:MAG: beta-ketoacyl-[acyl-carrier-protein] synthase family protein [Planctomycetaceae bacterium]|uniref:Actinorhodin polyketide putative beta-ketoacyl synthase 1 n=1 Tax=Lacipirellula limnantheis TaxID=2528024 RepID=A0A517TW21_9BACT|nr:beta-ketoacyl-[acyl-carrier-protein] synthase family protein [Lacipirellula limnantheis]MBL9164695.1 beta-ketoacyl-[acyl-carrier-protein] synthase family protein [Planctomycetaceae bacterium]QDT72562.1 Actinorhodin polyketide putative beta-ketoacyl synthase 1 [Lacipirellula limnantheis]